MGNGLDGILLLSRLARYFVDLRYVSLSHVLLRLWIKIYGNGFGDVLKGL
jgi:hypothetical protein